MDESDLHAVEARVDAVADSKWLTEDPEGELRIVGRLGDEAIEMQVRRDLDPATEGDVRFVAGALADIRHLLHAVGSGEQLGPDEIASIESRIEAASPGPWTAFIEADGGQAGCDVI